MARLLLVTGADAAGDAWASALAGRLAAHGLLDVDRAGPEALDDPAGAGGAGQLLLVGELDREAWTAGRVGTLRRTDLPMILESRLPSRVLRALRITAAPPGAEGTLTVADGELAANVRTWGADAGAGVPLAPGTRPWTVPERTLVLARWAGTEGGEGHPAIIRRRLVVACAFGLLGAAASPAHDVVLLALIDELSARCGLVRARLAAPPGAPVTLRHEAGGDVVLTAAGDAGEVALELRPSRRLILSRTVAPVTGVPLRLTPAGDERPPPGTDPPAPPPGAPASVADAHWAAVWCPAFTRLVRAYCARTDNNPEDEAVRSTVHVNTDLVPARGAALMQYLDAVLEPGVLAGREVLDVGSGFGAIGTYVALRCGPATMTAVDANARLVGMTRAMMAEHDLPGLRIAEADMRTLDGIPDASADVAIVNNSLLLLTSAKEVAQALSSVARVLRPGGRVLVFQANRWRRRDPFTGAPVVHLLPPVLARPVARATGWEHTHERARFLSGPGLMRALRRAGLRDVRAGELREGAVTLGVRAWAGEWIAVGGRKPA